MIYGKHSFPPFSYAEGSLLNQETDTQSQQLTRAHGPQDSKMASPSQMVPYLTPLLQGAVGRESHFKSNSLLGATRVFLDGYNNKKAGLTEVILY